MVIDACMRDGDSRTRRVLEPLVAELGKRYEIETVRLDGEDYAAVGRRVLAERSSGYVPEETVALARRLAGADRIVIAAPFWDMSFPAILKVFIENMSLYNITFKDSGTHFEGLCRSEKLLYVTTRGMNVRTGDPLEAATPLSEGPFRALGLWRGDYRCCGEPRLQHSRGGGCTDSRRSQGRSGYLQEFLII